jgi:DnaJ-class molecular chaperone
VRADKFAEIARTYEVLSDSDKKEIYNKHSVRKVEKAQKIREAAEVVGGFR